MTEVMHHRVPEEDMAEPLLTWRPDDSARSGDMQEMTDNNGISEKSVYFDKKEGSTSASSLSDKNLNLENIDIPKLVNAVMFNNENGINVKDNEIVSVTNKLASAGEEEEENINTSNAVYHENLKIDLVEESDEEIIELEFERAVEKIHTHTAYCPNCSCRITKVVLRRRKKDNSRRDKPLDLFGCLSCFGIFVPSGNGRLNPFRIFGNKGKQESTQIVEEKHELDVDSHAHADESTTIKHGAGKAFDLFWIFRKGKEKENEQNSQGYNQDKQKGESSKEEESSDDNSTTPLPVSSLHIPLLHGNKSSDDAIKDQNYESTKIGEPLKPGHYPKITPPDASVPSGELAIDIGDGIESTSEGATSEIREDLSAKSQPHPGIGSTCSTDDKRALVSNIGSSKSVEILKCIVYGGLMESIASLSVVSSAAASDATTLNIIAIGFATVISGLFLFGHNLIDLKNDNVGRNTSDHRDKYQELLGTRGHFLLHSSFSILSFLLFGLIPPVIYGFTFRESDDKDYKILAVALASFTCVFVLATSKAYVQRQKKFNEYVKTISYYLTTAICASGVSYAAGDLFKMLMERLGWFEPAQADTSTWASY